nr:uncharacterized protein LOC124490576 [Dermatophagoides farinae]
MFEKMNNNNNDNSWVQFDDQQTSDQQQSSLPTTINSLKTIDSKSVVVNDDGDGDDNINKSAIRLKSSNSSAENNQQSQQQQQQQFATIDLSANSTTQVLQINGGNSGGNGGGGGNSTNIAGSSSSSSNLTKSNHSNTSSSVLNIPKSGFSNGDIVVTLYPLNNNCAWLTPATFKAHLVPEELMAQPLTLTVEDYVSTMSILLSDYRFHLYITLHKRILALWITLSIIVLLGILASGTKGLSIFLSGIMWLVLNALGIFLVIFIKSRLYRMLEECLSQINSIFGRHNIFLGIDDRGHFSCHKINLIFVYFDPKYCIKFLQDMLKNNNNKDLQTTKHQHQNNRNQQNIDTSILDGNSGDNRFIGDDDNIYITGSSGTRQISQKEKQAEKLLYRYSQRWIREFGRQRMSLSIIQPQPEQSSSSSSSSLQPQQQQQQQSNNSNQQQQQQQQQQSINITIPSSTDIPPRHCRQAKCFCQFIEEMYRGKQQQQQQQQQQSFGNFCLTSFLPCISMIPSFCR